ncbi:MAG TPA: hypothetical protein VKA44_00375, partial [Gemmatimonadota bacterium]|nr:hypothetical protein [Gemmatimonadota bacterium]
MEHAGSRMRRARPGTARAGAVLAAACLAAAAGLTASGSAAAQGTDDWCRQERHGGRDRYCEVRESTIEAPSGGLDVDARPNGAIDVTAVGS